MDLNLSDEEVLHSNFPAGIYRHYKSTDDDPKLYNYEGLARHTETGELLAIYTPLYHDPNHTGPAKQGRPAGMFFGKTEYNGESVQRFTFTGTGR